LENNEFIQPARKLKKTFRSVTGYFPSKKNNRQVAFESLLERNLFLSLEFDGTVKSYLEQPVKINLELKNRKTTYHPDCLINYTDGTSKLIEAKYSTELDKKADYYHEKFSETKKYALANNMDFGIFTEKDISKETIYNMLFLYNFAFTTLPDTQASEIVKVLRHHKEVTADSLMQALSSNRLEQAKILPFIWKMVFDGAIHVDYIDTKLSMQSILRLVKNG
jgi:hypothetical protein